MDIFLKQAELATQEYEEYENKIYENTINYIYHMSKSELQEALIDILDISPDWIYERFVRDRIGYK